MSFKRIVIVIAACLLLIGGIASFLIPSGSVADAILLPFCGSEPTGIRSTLCKKLLRTRVEGIIAQKNERLAFKEGERFPLALNKTDSIDAEHSEYSITGPQWLKDRINGCAMHESVEYLTKINWGDGSSSGDLLSKHGCNETKNKHIYDRFGGKGGGQGQSPVTIHATIEMIRVDASGIPVPGIPVSFAEQYVSLK